MNKIPDRSHQWFEVQRHLGQVHVAQQSGDLPRLQPGQALLKMVANLSFSGGVRWWSMFVTKRAPPDGHRFARWSSQKAE